VFFFSASIYPPFELWYLVVRHARYGTKSLLFLSSLPLSLVLFPFATVTPNERPSRLMPQNKMRVLCDTISHTRRPARLIATQRYYLISGATGRHARHRIISWHGIAERGVGRPAECARERKKLNGVKFLSGGRDDMMCRF